jgi:hypothetical protein
MKHLRNTVDSGEIMVARTALRKHLHKLVLTPTIMNGKRAFRVYGNVTLIPEESLSHGPELALTARGRKLLSKSVHECKDNVMSSI